MMNTAITAEASGRLKASPPSLTGLSRKSPTVAPSGRVRMNAAQNRQHARNVRPEIERREHRQAGGEDQRAAVIAEAPVSAVQSPSAVPSVCENVIASQ